jgi:hypothetical protein
MFIEMKKGYIVKYVQRHQAKLNDRPNLQDWKQQIDSIMVNNPYMERQVAKAFDDAHCEVCALEKWPGARFCWNESCPVSPVYFKLTGVAVPGPGPEDGSGVGNDDVTAVTAIGTSASISALTSEGQRVSVQGQGQGQDAAQSSDGARADIARPAAAASKPNTYTGQVPHSLCNGPIPNPANDFLLHVPSRIVGADAVSQRGLSRTFSSTAVLAPRENSRPVSNSLVDQSGAMRGMMIVTDSAQDAFSDQQTRDQQQQEVYTQYYYEKQRKDSFAGGDTDTEVNGSPLTVP